MALVHDGVEFGAVRLVGFGRAIEVGVFVCGVDFCDVGGEGDVRWAVLGVGGVFG